MNEGAEQESPSEPGVDVPEDITIEIPWTLGQKIILHCRPEGIDYVKGKTRRSYSWDDVSQLQILRKDAEDRGFIQLSLRLPEKEIVLKGRPRQWIEWSGPTPEVIAAFLQKYVPPPTLGVLVDPAGWRPKSPEEVDRMIQAIEDSQNSGVKDPLTFLFLPKVRVVLTVIVFILAIVLPLSDGEVDLGGVVAFVVWVLFWWVVIPWDTRKDQKKKQIESLRKLRAELAAKESGEPGEALNHDDEQTG